MRKLRLIHVTLAKSHISSHHEAKIRPLDPGTLGPWAYLALELLTNHTKEQSPKGMGQKPECVSERVEG